MNLQEILTHKDPEFEETHLRSRINLVQSFWKSQPCKKKNYKAIVCMVKYFKTRLNYAKQKSKYSNPHFIRLITQYKNKQRYNS